MSTIVSPRTLAVFLLVLIVFSRFIFLESDIPVWELSSYCQIDELYYTQFSFSSDSVTPDTKALLFNPAQSFLTKLSIMAVGNNYYGLRLPSVIFSLAGFSILTVVFYRRFSMLGVLVFGLFFLVDFSSILMSRVAEPTSSRFFAMALAIYLCTQYIRNIEKHSSYLLVCAGLVSVLLVLLFYPTNAFILLSVAAIVLFFSKDKQIIITIAKFFCGCILGLFLYLFFMYLAGFLHDFNGIIYLNESFGERISVSGNDFSQIFKSIKSNIYQVKDANFFRLNIYFRVYFLFLLFMTIIILFINKNSIKKEKHKFTIEDIVMTIFLCCFMIQSLFINDYPQRKLVIIFPFIVYIFIFCGVFIASNFRSDYAGFVFTVLVLFSIIPHAIFSYKNIYSSPSYTYKESMQALSSLGDARLVGGWSYGFRLYNKTRPFLNKYYYNYNKELREYFRRETVRAVSSGYALGSLDYLDRKTRSFYASIGMKPDTVIFHSIDPFCSDVGIYK